MCKRIRQYGCCCFIFIKSLNGNTTFANGLTRREIYELVGTMKATQINEIIHKLEFVGLIASNNRRKNILYCITDEGTYVLGKVNINMKI